MMSLENGDRGMNPSGIIIVNCELERRQS